MLGAVMEKADNVQEQMSNLSREMKILRKNQKDFLEIKNTVTGLPWWRSG